MSLSKEEENFIKEKYIEYNKWEQVKLLDNENLTQKEREQRIKEIYGDDYIIENI